MLAVMWGMTEVVSLLLKAGVNIDLQNEVIAERLSMRQLIPHCILEIVHCMYSSGFHLGGGGGKGGHLPPPPLDPECPPLDIDFILLHRVVVDAAPPYISNTLVCPPLIKCLDETLYVCIYVSLLGIQLFCVPTCKHSITCAWSFVLLL